VIVVESRHNATGFNAAFLVLDVIDRAMLGAILAKPTTTDGELGRMIGLSRTAVNYRRNRPVFRRAIDEHSLDALTILRRNQSRAASRLGQLVDSDSEPIALAAAREHLRPILQREGAGDGGSSWDTEFADFLQLSFEQREGDKALPSGEPIPVGKGSTS
jgi:hypothetical protein